ncbi:hypothetical protein [uncultured Sphaerochaeta sp.]|uniref:hypothetical protein n=1 Tax=uncultured Sphaerochaeta sp. TaxID=886478 RepID=UPI002A0A2066|nr:hypothetical protein [uncultured Sphaerochaeta sp.]
MDRDTVFTAVAPPEVNVPFTARFALFGQVTVTSALPLPCVRYCKVNEAVVVLPEMMFTLASEDSMVSAFPPLEGFPLYPTTLNVHVPTDNPVIPIGLPSSKNCVSILWASGSAFNAPPMDTQVTLVLAGSIDLESAMDRERDPSSIPGCSQETRVRASRTNSRRPAAFIVFPYRFISSSPPKGPHCTGPVVFHSFKPIAKTGASHAFPLYIHSQSRTINKIRRIAGKKVPAPP